MIATKQLMQDVVTGFKWEKVSCGHLGTRLSDTWFQLEPLFSRILIHL